MRTWAPEELAAAAGARVVAAPSGESEGPLRVVIDSRAVRPGDLFVGLPGTQADGGAFARRALQDGAWGVLVAAPHASGLSEPGVVLEHPDPLLGLHALALAWRRALRAKVIAITGSTGKTSTKDIVGALLAPHRRTVVSPLNHNTEIGLPLAVLGAPAGTEVLVLEMGMRGRGQIAELTAIAEPDVGVIVSVGPVHLELLGSLEAIAATKAELIAGLTADATAVIPVSAPLLAPHARADLQTVRFGVGGDVSLEQILDDGTLVIAARGEHVRLRPSFTAEHQRAWNLLAAVAAVQAVGVLAGGELDVQFSAGRGDHIDLAGGLTLVNDCYNANPMSMRAALVELSAAPARRVAVLGDMLELGPEAETFHGAVGEQARSANVDLLITVGPLAAAMASRFNGETAAFDDAVQAAEAVPRLVRDGDTVLVKGSQGVGLMRVVDALMAERPLHSTTGLPSAVS